MKPALGDATALARALTRVDSRNPSLVADGPGEQAVASTLADILESWGFEVSLVEAAAQRPNVVALLKGTGGGRSLLFNGHLDVVGTEGMTHAPFAADVRDGRLYGRGACDMKGGVAAMCAAAARIRGAGRGGNTLKGDVILTAVVDEEWRSIGTSALIAQGMRADAAIVTEPTGLRIMPAHKGFVWIEALVRGRAAHGSRWDLGVDAIRHAGLLLAELDRLDAEELPRRSHPLLGRPSLHASTIEGGLGLSTYPDRCVVRIERRTIPGETLAQVQAEMRAACDRVRRERAAFAADLSVLFAQPPSDVGADEPIVRALRDQLAAHSLPFAPVGMSAWTDAALWNSAGVPAICFGPGDMGMAHAAEEYIACDEIEAAADILAALAREWCT